MKTKKSFEEWMKQVDAILERRLGLSSLDLPDVCYADMYEGEDSPGRAAGRAIRYAKGCDE